MDMLYWVDSSSHTISRIKRDLTERETIVTDEIPGIEDIAVDWISGMYITMFSTMSFPHLEYVLLSPFKEIPQSLENFSNLIVYAY